MSGGAWGAAKALFVVASVSTWGGAVVHELRSLGKFTPMPDELRAESVPDNRWKANVGIVAEFAGAIGMAGFTASQTVFYGSLGRTGRIVFLLGAMVPYLCLDVFFGRYYNRLLLLEGGAYIKTHLEMYEYLRGGRTETHCTVFDVPIEKVNFVETRGGGAAE